MGLAQRTEDVDTHAYWADVNDALMEVCGLSRQDATDAVAKSRQALTRLSEWGRLLAYHDSVPQAAEDIWKQGPGAAVLEKRAQSVQQELIEWYAERNRKRGLSHGATGSSAKEAGWTDISGAGADGRQAARRSSIAPEGFFDEMAERSPGAPGKLEQFLEDAVAVDIRPEYLASLNLYWDRPGGGRVNLGYIKRNGEIWTDGSYGKVDWEIWANYIAHLAVLFDGEVSPSQPTKDGSSYLYIMRHGARIRVDSILDRLSDWIMAIKAFQDAVRERA